MKALVYFMAQLSVGDLLRVLVSDGDRIPGGPPGAWVQIPSNDGEAWTQRDFEAANIAVCCGGRWLARAEEPFTLEMAHTIAAQQVAKTLCALRSQNPKAAAQLVWDLCGGSRFGGLVPDKARWLANAEGLAIVGGGFEFGADGMPQEATNYAHWSEVLTTLSEVSGGC